jgi:hypothetical protein
VVLWGNSTQCPNLPSCEIVIKILSAKEWDVMVVGWDAIVHVVVFVRAGKGEGWTAEVSMLKFKQSVRVRGVEVPLRYGAK